MKLIILCLVCISLFALGAVATEAPEAPAAPEAVETTAVSELEQSEEWSADQWLEAQSTVDLSALFPGGQCGTAICGEGEFCCNESCSTCAPLGGYCTQQICPPVW